MKGLSNVAARSSSRASFQEFSSAALLAFTLLLELAFAFFRCAMILIAASSDLEVK